VQLVTRTVALVLFAVPLATHAQQAAKPPRIGHLREGSASDAAAAALVEAFRQGLRERGWLEGQNVAIEYRLAEGRRDRLPDLVAELVRLKVDVIFAPTTAATVAAHNATRAIPIIMASFGDPVGRGIIASLARPGGNVTGLSYSVELGIVDKQLELLKVVVPKVSRVAVLGDPGHSQYGSQLREAEVASRSLGVRLQVVEARGPSQYDSAFGAMVRKRAEALLVLPDPVSFFGRRPHLDLAAKHRLPASYGSREFVDAGGLISYGPSLSDLWRRAATYVDKILRGAKPGDLPVEQPTKFELVINLKTAKALGLTIPQSVLLRADEVIE
jgi:putative tryptophan/tyrosine transport system substrate-binding protein